MSQIMTDSYHQISAMSINGFVVMFVSIVFNIAFPQFLAGAGTTKSGWSVMIIGMGIAMSIIGILRFVFCKEIVEDKPTESGQVTNNLNMGESLKLVVKNKYLLIIVALMLMTFMVNNMTTATNYYFTYIMGDIGLASTAAITTMVVVPALIFFPMISNKVGTTKILQGCSLIGAVGMVIRTVGGPNMPTIIVGSLLMGIGTLPISMMINTYLIDCMDYGEWKTGTRIEGLVASIANFASKVGNGLALGLVGLVMGMAGYDGLAEVQTAAANNAIIFLYNIVPLILFVVMFVLSLMYQVDKTRDQMNADLQKKRGEDK